jgi:hypothetical protein
LLPDPHKTLPDGMKTAVAEFIDRNYGAVLFFVQAAKHEQSRYPIDLTQGQATMLPHLAKIKSAAKLLELLVLSHADANEGDMAGKGILTGLALAQSLESEPSLISQLVRVACVKLAVDGLEQSLNRTVLPSETFGALQKSLQAYEKSETSGVGFTRALVAERVIGLSLFNRSPEEYLTVSDKATPAEREKLTLQIKATLAVDRQLFEATFVKASALRSRPFPLRSRNDIFLQGATQATNQQLLLSSMLLPALDKSSFKEADSLALLRLAQTAVVLEQFRSAHDDHYPKSLRELMPEFLKVVPIDPFDGQNLRYQKEGGGYVLYSIGQNLKDDNGKRLKQPDGDLVFSVTVPPKA